MEDDDVPSEADAAAEALIAAKQKKIDKFRLEMWEHGIVVSDEMIARLLSAPAVQDWRPTFGRVKKETR